MEKRTDEINLFDFIITCWNGIVSLCKFLLSVLLKTVRLSIQNIWIVLICMFLGVGVAYYFSRYNVAQHKSETTITYNEGMEPYISSGLRLFFAAPSSVLEEYGLDASLRGDLDRVDFFNIIDASVNVSTLAIRSDAPVQNANIHDNSILVPDFTDYNYTIGGKDSIHVIMKDRICLSLRINGYRDVNGYKSAILAFIKDQPAIEAADRHYRAIRTEHLRLLDKEVARLDSLSSYDYFERDRVKHSVGSNSTAIYSEEKRNVYYDALLVVMKKRDYLKAQLLNNPEVVNFQSDFVTTSMMLRSHKLIYGIVFGYLLSLLISLLWKYRKDIVSYMKA